MVVAARVVPNLFIVGAPKCGTTSLSEYLRGHPNVFMCFPKEPLFFADDLLSRDLRGYVGVATLEQYKKLFANCTSSHKTVAEASSWYLLSRKAIPNIYAYNPEAKIIALVRDPIEIVHSYHSQMVYNFQEDEPDVREAWRLQDRRKCGLAVPKRCWTPELLQYRDVAKVGRQVARLYSVFPPTQIKVVLFDDLLADVKGTYESILAFLELPSDGRTKFPRLNPNKGHRIRWVGELLQQPPVVFRLTWKRLEAALGPEISKAVHVLRELNTRSLERPPLDPAFHAELAAEFREDVATLSKIIGRNLDYWLSSPRGDTSTKRQSSSVQNLAIHQAESQVWQHRDRVHAPLSVLHVITDLRTGGAERMLTSLLTHPWPEGTRSEVVSLISRGELRSVLEGAGVCVRDVGARDGISSLALLWRLARIIRRSKPDVVQSWMYHADLTATLGLLLSGRRRKTRLYWGVRCSNMDTRQYSWTLASVIRACTRMSHIPDAVIANSEAGTRYHLDIGYRPRRFLIVDNGVDTESFRPDPAARRRMREALGIAADQPVLALVARVDPMKDHDCFLEALERLPGVAALAVGEGTERLPDRTGLFRLGQRDDIPALLGACDLLVSSSAFGEGFSNAILEGMSCGLPAVATDVGDARRIVGDTGLIVPPRKPAALAGAIRTLLSETPTARCRRGLAARRRVIEHYSLARAIERFGELYAEQARGDQPERERGRGTQHLAEGSTRDVGSAKG